MNLHHRTLIALAVIFFLIAPGPVQAHHSAQAVPITTSGTTPAYPINHWNSGYIYTPDSAGLHVSLAFDPDHEHAAWVSYYNETRGSLWVAHFVGPTGGNCGQGNTWRCDEVDYQAGVPTGLESSLDIHPDTNPDPDISNWKVGVSYIEPSTKSLKYAKYSCVFEYICSWSISTVVYGALDQNDYLSNPSLKFSHNGVPNIALFVQDERPGFITSYYLFHASQVGIGTGDCFDGSDWDCGMVDEIESSTSNYPSLDFNYFDTVFIAYYDPANQDLKYTYPVTAGNGNCGETANWSCQVIDSSAGDNVGLFPSLHAPKNFNDHLRVAYYDATHGNLKYASAGWGGAGNCGPGDGWQCDTIDAMGVGLSWASISLAVNRYNTPMIAYTDASEDLAPLSLKVAEPASGQDYANCGVGLLYDWWCGHLDGGGAYLDVGRYASLAIRPDGMAMVAYSELDSYENPYNYDLKFTRQVLWSFLPVAMN